MSDLESVPGTALSCNVFPPRLRRPNAVELSMDMGYWESDWNISGCGHGRTRAL